jgi:hypothetical protein
MTKKFVKVLEWATDEPDAWKKSGRLLETMNLSPVARIKYSIGAKYVKGRWAACLFEETE